MSIFSLEDLSQFSAVAALLTLFRSNLFSLLYFWCLLSCLFFPEVHKKYPSPSYIKKKKSLFFISHYPFILSRPHFLKKLSTFSFAFKTLKYIWHIPLYKLRCTACRFDMAVYCHVIAIVALASTLNFFMSSPLIPVKPTAVLALTISHNCFFKGHLDVPVMKLSRFHLGPSYLISLWHLTIYHSIFFWGGWFLNLNDIIFKVKCSFFFYINLYLLTQEFIEHVTKPNR